MPSSWKPSQKTIDAHIESVRKLGKTKSVWAMQKELRTSASVIKACLAQLGMEPMKFDFSAHAAEAHWGKKKLKTPDAPVQPRICNGSMTELYNPNARQITTRYAR